MSLWPARSPALPRAGLPRATGALRVLLAGLLLSLLAACGGVSEDGTGAPAVSVGQVTGLSDTTLTVSGVQYDLRSAQVTDGLDAPAASDSLRLGMWVEVHGTLDASGQAGSATRIRLRPSARGVVSAIDEGSPLVLGTRVHVAAQSTVLASADGSGSLSVGDVVEVHGALGEVDGTVEATRVERLSTVSSARPYELRGRVRQLDTAAHRLLLGGLWIDYTHASVALGRTLANGMVVRVAAVQGPQPGLDWAVERLSADQDLPESADFLYVEGVVSGWTAGPSFMIEELPVDASGAVGRDAVTANGLRVAAVGALRHGTLLAKAVTVATPGQPVEFVFSGRVSDFVSVADFVVRGVHVDASQASFSNDQGSGSARLTNDRKVRVTGSLSGRRVVASQIRYLD